MRKHEPLNAKKDPESTTKMGKNTAAGGRLVKPDYAVCRRGTAT